MTKVDYKRTESEWQEINATVREEWADALWSDQNFTAWDAYRAWLLEALETSHH